MKGAQTARLRLMAPIAVGIIAILLIFVIATSFGGSGSEDSRGGGGGGGAGKTNKPKQKKYVVEPGDSLTTISEKTGVSVERLTRLNPDLDPQALLSGQQVKLRR